MPSPSPPNLASHFNQTGGRLAPVGNDPSANHRWGRPRRLLLLLLLPAVAWAQTNTFPSSGNVGIGTTSPSYLLDVAGVGGGGAAVRLTPDTGRVRIDGVDLLGYPTQDLWTIGNSPTVGLILGTSWNWDNQVALRYAPGTAGAGAGVFSIGQDPNDHNAATYTHGITRFLTNGAERLRIDSTGRVGIGTTSPGEKLEVAGNIKLTNSTITAGVRALTPTGWGYNPNSWRVLQVGAASGNESVAIGYDPSGNTNGAFTGDGREVLFRNGVQFVTPNAANNAFNLSNLVLKDGNVGIGTTTPGVKLTAVSSSDGVIARFTAPTNPQIELTGSSINAIFTASDSAGAFLGTRTAHPLNFYTNGAIRGVIDTSGNVGIGTTNPTQKLSVNGTIRAKEVVVDTGWSDYVFDQSYRLKTLSEVEAYVKTEHHLPGIPSAQEVAEHGVTLGDMQSRLLAKIEELTLHQFEQEKRLQKLETENAALRAGHHD